MVTVSTTIPTIHVSNSSKVNYTIKKLSNKRVVVSAGPELFLRDNLDADHFMTAHVSNTGKKLDLLSSTTCHQDHFFLLFSRLGAAYLAR